MEKKYQKIKKKNFFLGIALKLCSICLKFYISIIKKTSFKNTMCIAKRANRESWSYRHNMHYIKCNLIDLICAPNRKSFNSTIQLIRY